jgi:hypothetical protein
MIIEYDLFCANAACALHVRRGDAHVNGWGNWAKLSDGIIVGRRRVNDIMLCDRCAASAIKSERESMIAPEVFSLRA